MRSRLAVLSMISLCSCAVFSKYESNQDRVYRHSLSDEEKRRINADGKILKTWNGTNSLGDYEQGALLIIPATPSKYKFIEVGHWETLHKMSKGNRNLGSLKQTMNFDSLGNLRSGQYYRKPKEAKDFYLAEKITSTITEQKKLILFSERFDAGGRKMYHVLVEYVNYLKLDSDRMKERVMVGYLYLDANGDPVNPYRDKESEGIIRIVRMKK